MKHKFHQLFHGFYLNLRENYYAFLQVVFCIVHIILFQMLCYAVHVCPADVERSIEWGIAKKLLKEAGQSLRCLPDCLKLGLMCTLDNGDHFVSAMYNWTLPGKKNIINLCVSHGPAITQRKHNTTLPPCFSRTLAHLLSLSWP